MACCNVNRCCCCIEHTLGVKLLSLFLILLEVLYVVLVYHLYPDFITYIAVACAFGFFSNILLLIAVFRAQRWFCIPWMIYVMLVVVAFCLTSVLNVVMALTGPKSTPDWLAIATLSAGCLGLAGMYMYFWIVVLELFIKMGPLYYMSAVPPPGTVMGGPVVPMGPYGHAQGHVPPVPVHAVMYDSRQPDTGPQSLFATPPNPQQQHIMYQQPNSLPPMYYAQANVKQY